MRFSDKHRDARVTGSAVDSAPRGCASERCGNRQNRKRLQRQFPGSPRWLPLLLSVLLLLGGVTACRTDGEGAAPTSGSVSPVYSLTREDSRTQPENAAEIALGTVDSELLITEKGDYLLTGSLTGCIHILAEEQVVHLFLKGVDIRGAKSPAIYIESAGKVVVTVCADTENRLRDSGAHTGRDTDACLYSRSDLTLNGTGTLTVSGLFKDAVHTRDYLSVTGVNLTVQARRDGLRGNDGMLIRDARLHVESEENGLHTTRSDKAEKGNVEIIGTDLTVIAGAYAVSADRNILIADSRAFLKGIPEPMHADGEIAAEEGCLRDE